MLLTIFDIDGTLANPGDRFKQYKMPKVMSYKTSKREDKQYRQWLNKVQKRLNEDKPDINLRKLVNIMQDVWECEAIYLTSREEKYRKATEKWLEDNRFAKCTLYMRPNGDKRSYSELKRDIISNILAYLNHHPVHVLVIDDDPKNKLRRLCNEQGWTLLKASNGYVAG